MENIGVKRGYPTKNMGGIKTPRMLSRCISTILIFQLLGFESSFGTVQQLPMKFRIKYNKSDV